MDEYCVSKKGRILVPARAIDTDFRRLMIDHMISNGGDILTGYFPGSVNSVADHFKLKASSYEPGQPGWLGFRDLASSLFPS